MLQYPLLPTDRVVVPAHPRPTHRPAPAGSCARAGEQGFSVVQLVIVMVIAGILTAVAAPSFLGAKSTAARNNAIAAAASYDQAITRFMGDHGNTVPQANATDMLGTNGTRGPRNLLGAAYIRSVPSAVDSGAVAASLVGGTAPAATTNTARLWYEPGVSPTYRIVVQTRPDSNTAWTAGAASIKTCYLGNTTSTPRC